MEGMQCSFRLSHAHTHTKKKQKSDGAALVGSTVLGVMTGAAQRFGKQKT